MSSLVYGAKAQVLIDSDESFEVVADKISKGFTRVSLSIETREGPPYEKVGSCEALGFEVWLEKKEKFYCLSMETEHSLNESFEERMYDLSGWVARYLSEICELTTRPVSVRPVDSRL